MIKMAIQYPGDHGDLLKSITPLYFSKLNSQSTSLTAKKKNWTILLNHPQYAYYKCEILEDYKIFIQRQKCALADFYALLTGDIIQSQSLVIDYYSTQSLCTLMSVTKKFKTIITPLIAAECKTVSQQLLNNEGFNNICPSGYLESPKVWLLSTTPYRRILLPKFAASSLLMPMHKQTGTHKVVTFELQNSLKKVASLPHKDAVYRGVYRGVYDPKLHFITVNYTLHKVELNQTEQKSFFFVHHSPSTSQSKEHEWHFMGGLPSRSVKT